VCTWRADDPSIRKRDKHPRRYLVRYLARYLNGYLIDNRPLSADGPGRGPEALYVNDDIDRLEPLT
jgi:hypothetical protein